MNDHLDELLPKVDIIFATARAGIQVLNEEQVAAATRLKVAADLNAVPPAGIAGISLQDNGVPLKASASGAVGIGPLAIGDIKYKTQQKLLIQMYDAGKPVYLDFENAFDVAMKKVK